MAASIVAEKVLYDIKAKKYDLREIYTRNVTIFMGTDTIMLEYLCFSLFSAFSFCVF
jgi:hypothetical protein